MHISYTFHQIKWNQHTYFVKSNCTYSRYVDTTCIILESIDPCKCPEDVHLNNFCHLNTLWNAWPRVLFATIAVSSWRRSQSLTRPAWGMTVNVNFSDYFFCRYSNKDEPINDKIWCYKQHKLLHLSLYIWQGSAD